MYLNMVVYKVIIYILFLNFVDILSFYIVWGMGEISW